MRVTAKHPNSIPPQIVYPLGPIERQANTVPWGMVFWGGVYFIGGGVGGPGALPADNTPARRKTPLQPPPQTPPLLNLALGGVLSRISDFREPWYARPDWASLVQENKMYRES